MVVGAGEADRWLLQALQDIKWCDEICVCLNNVDKKTEQMVKDFGCQVYYDYREWGKEQWKIKEDFFHKFIIKFNPDWIIAKDADEIFDKNFNRREAECLADKGGTGYHFYVVNLYNAGYNVVQSFWNVRFWRYNPEWNNTWTRRNLHCGLYPTHIYRYANYAPFILKHYGLQKKEDRGAKVARYKKYDPYCRWMRMNNTYYEFLNKPAKVSPFNENELHQKAVDYANKTYFKQPNMNEDKRKVYYFRRVKDDALIPVYEDQVEEHKKQLDPFTRQPMFLFVGEVEQKKSGVEAPVGNSLKCVICGFEAKTKVGLDLHMKIHNENNNK